MMNTEVRNWVAEDAIENYKLDLNSNGTECMEVGLVLADYIRDAIDSYELDGDDPEDIEDEVYDEIFDEAEALYHEHKEYEKGWREERKRWYWN